MTPSATAIDLFAGAGGFSTGARAAGVSVLWAGNHWPEAVQIHANNHPDTVHICQDLHQADWSQVPSHDLLMASPCCQGHSKARGKSNGDPQHDASRSTAWAVVSAAEFHKPPIILVENVPEFCKWSLYPAWKLAIESLGYSISPHIIDAADHGVPQNRRRLFLVCARSKAPIVLFMESKPLRTAATIIDESATKWTKIEKPRRSPNTIERIRNGRKALGDRFLVAYYGNEHGGRSLNRPVGTITTNDRYALISGDEMRMLNITEYRRAMGFPDDYILPKKHKDALKMLGNAVCPPVVTDIIQEIRRTA